MEQFNPELLKQLYIPADDSHKGQNGKLMVIGGSHLFHAASLWALTVAGRILDMVFYSSVPENNAIVHKLKKEFRNGIIVPREQIEDYIEEADAVLIGPGMLRAGQVQSSKLKVQSLEEINKLEHEGEQSYFLTKYLLEKYPTKRWVIDAGALQMMDLEWLLPLGGNAILTPHIGEFERIKLKIKNEKLKMTMQNKKLEEQIAIFAQEFKCVILVKSQVDIVCSPGKCWRVSGGNAGMTKGGTGDVLAGLVASLACKNDLLLSAMAGSYINKKAGESLFERTGIYFNASDLANEIPAVMKSLL